MYSVYLFTRELENRTDISQYKSPSHTKRDVYEATSIFIYAPLYSGYWGGALHYSRRNLIILSKPFPGLRDLHSLGRCEKHLYWVHYLPQDRGCQRYSQFPPPARHSCCSVVRVPYGGSHMNWLCHLSKLCHSILLLSFCVVWLGNSSMYCN